MSDAARPERGVTALAELLASMRPELDPEPWVFATAATALPDAAVTVVEREGVTSVVRERDLDDARALAPEVQLSAPFARITLTVHSDLEAVGLTAAIASALAGQGIPANVVAGYFHDHVFVPWQRASDALDALRALGAGDARR
ncbi:hypothetical protein EV141_0950 [Microcella putealis]|uniref:Uncharacterized protein n=1 Tax=Microcella putealis TaxID=337005 RepID=A0A4Q7LZ69_9MICO|nr:ACT domain-containing protein [Microcella putealis]RZS59717.1 hypothetical protein EV141_0950 [Microcella putealis]TQM26830.1 hypothetical protein BJ957_0246 [Microcella putealis]